LALWLAALSAPVAAQLSDPAWMHPPAPKPAAIPSEELPAVFRKPKPASLADLRSIQQHVTALLPKVSPAVVAVEIGNGSGSGVVISSDGLVLTAGHVAERRGLSAVFRFPDGKTARGKTIGLDEDSDTGLMRITDRGPWPHVDVGDLAQVRLGDWVLALGHPGGFDAARSLVVRLGRVIRLMPGVVQTDCTILPGDSGGPLIDMYGRVIGIHTAISGSTDENFHVPISEFFDAWPEMAGPSTSSTISTRPLAYAGVTVMDDYEGCRLSGIDKDSPAFKAGLKVNDRVLKVDGRRVIASATFERWVAESQPRDTLHLQIERRGREMSIPLHLQSQPHNRNVPPAQDN
jgi:serine protease Do